MTIDVREEGEAGGGGGPGGALPVAFGVNPGTRYY